MHDHAHDHDHSVSPDSNHDGVQQMVDSVLEARDIYDKILGGLGFIEVIDEIAFLTPSIEENAAFIRGAVQNPHIVHFNAASDVVHSEPFNTNYSVAYDFLRVDNAPVEFRLEVMLLTIGHSPLH